MILRSSPRRARVTISAAALLSTLCLATPAARGQGFEDVAGDRGLDSRHWDGRGGQYHFVETVASGGGWLDHDGDGDLDVYVINGAPTPGGPTRVVTNRLFEQRDGRFFDATARSGLGDDGYGMGFCTGDADGDSTLDVFVTNYGPDSLYRGLGEGRYEEIGERAGVAGDSWSVSCAFGDVDADGDLDLYVSRYVDAPFDSEPECRDNARGLRFYCNPNQFDAQRDALFINRGDGSFRDEGAERGIVQGKLDRGLGVALVDLDADGDLDVFVANDSAPNRMHVNDGAGRFSDRALVAGTALNVSGMTEAGMGVAVGDEDGDGLPDLVVGNFSLETNTFYRNLGEGLFDDATESLGLSAPSFEPLTWGLELFDADNDGDLDLAAANGHIMENIDRFVPGLTYEQANQFYENDSGRLVDASDRFGPGWAATGVSRALAVGDWNDDGCLDVLVTNTNGPVQLLQNRCPPDNHWLGIALVDTNGGPGWGARVRATHSGRAATRWIRSGGSVMSQNDVRAHFGLGGSTEPVELEILWPDGSVHRETVRELDRYLTVRHGGR